MRVPFFQILLVSACSAAPLPTPLALWDMQEATGFARVSRGTAGAYKLVDGNKSAPIATVSVPGGAPFGPFAASFSPHNHNNSARLFAPRASVPNLTEGISGPDARVTLLAWVSPAAHFEGGPFVAGVWDEYGVHGGVTGARQYALFLSLGACASSGANYSRGLAGHISPVGGPTPGERFCTTAACDPRALAPAPAWHCLAVTYDELAIKVYVNGTFAGNGAHNPFPLTGGIFDPAAHPGRIGAEFGVGANRVNTTVGGAPTWENAFAGLLGGVAVWDVALSEGDVSRACGLAPGF